MGSPKQHKKLLRRVLSPKAKRAWNGQIEPPRSSLPTIAERDEARSQRIREQIEVGKAEKRRGQ